jgi:hypothetical protein
MCAADFAKAQNPGRYASRNPTLIVAQKVSEQGRVGIAIEYRLARRVFRQANTSRTDVLVRYTF